MLRSEINAIIKDMERLAAMHNFYLPPFCSWSPEAWESKGQEYDEIRDNKLGWDITDYGIENFPLCGAAFITLRNGNRSNPKYLKTYSEKLLMLKEGQFLPFHFHWAKTEDIINRGGGIVVVTVYNEDGTGELADSDVSVSCDGRALVVPAGTKINLEPGESVTIAPRVFHKLTVLVGAGDVLISDVSGCNDDDEDIRFYEKIGRFPKIEEDEPPYRLLCNEYPAARA